MKIESDRGLASSVALALFLCASLTSAQTTMEAWGSGLVLNFSTPGARSLGLGGAFLGLSDDATAAYANPAGLVLLPDFEVSVEARRWRFNHLFTDRGRDGRPSGGGVDTIEGLRDGNARDDLDGLSFVSVVKPFRWGAIALYGHTLADFEANYQTQGAFFTNLATFRAFPTRNRVDLEIRTVGIALAVRVNESLSLGFGLSRSDFEIDNRTDRFCTLQEPPTDPMCPPFSPRGGPDFDTRVNFQTETGSDSDLGLTYGFLWTLNHEWQIGGVFRFSPEFEYIARRFKADGTERKDQTQRATFKVPHQFGLGAAYRPSTLDRFSIALDYYWIEYSRFTEDLVDMLGGDFREFADVPGDMEVEDAAEIHLGAEYFFADARRPFFLRAGVWSDPDHGLVYRGVRPFYRGVFPARERVTHYAFGAGITGRSYQADFAVDYSDRSVTTSLSTVVRF